MNSFSAQATAESAEFALVAVGDQQLGVPIAHVVQAIPRPTQITPLPRSAPALEGVFMLRGQIVPLISLLRWMTPERTEADTAQQVLVLRADDKTLGILIEGVKGVLITSPGHVRQIHHTPNGDELFHSVALAADQTTLISLLDATRLAAQTHVWAGDGPVTPHAESPSLAASAATHESAAPVSPTGSDHRSLHAVVRLATVRLGLPATAIGEVLPYPALQRLQGLRADLLGMVKWRDRDVPVLDLRHTLGLPEHGETSTPWLLMLDVQGQNLAFGVHEMCEVRSFSPTEIQSTQAPAGPMASLCSGSCLMEGVQRVHLLAPNALFAASPLSQLARTQAPQRPDGLHLPSRGATDQSALIVFKSKVHWAAAMQHMLEIITVPPALVCAAPDRHGVIGSVEWRGHAVPLIDLRHTLGASPTRQDRHSRIVLIQVDQHMAALLVQAVVALITGHTAARSHFMAQGAAVDMVTVGHGAQQKSYQLLDLARLSFFSAAQPERRAA